MTNKTLISIILPCRNEEQAMAGCLKQLKSVLLDHNLNGEIIVSDSSIDRSPAIAEEFGAHVVRHGLIGYGRAYLEGLKSATGEYVFMADPDGSYDFADMPKFINAIEAGEEFILGNRFGAKLEQDAMPWLHRYVGRPIFSLLFRLLYRQQIADVHCGMRLIKKTALDKMELESEGMEFASEMLIKAVKNHIPIKQVPINYSKRLGQPKLRTFPDGFRHLLLILKSIR